MISGPFPHFDPAAALQNVMIGHPHTADATSPFSVPSSSSSPYAVDLSDIHCRVCERKYDGSQHFGIDICRACAAFFRRSVSVKKTFICRRGTDLCPLNTITRKTTCQKCRWMRCLSVGLTVDLVNGRRSPDNLKHCQGSVTARKHKHEEDESDTGSEGRTAEEELFALSISSPLLRPIPHSGALDMDTTKATLINKVLLNYREFSEKRLEVERSLPHMQGDSKFFGPTGTPLFKATKESLTLIYQKQSDLLHDFLRNTFDAYAQCDLREQKRICDLFYPVLWEIESCYWTYRNMPVGPEYETLLMCTQTTYIDSRDVRYWIGNTDGQDQTIVQEKIEKLEALLATARSRVLEPMHNLILKEFEFILLLSLNIWANRNHRTCQDAAFRADTVRCALFDDFHILYHDGLKIDNYANRMGLLMCLFTEVQNADMCSIIQDVLFSDLSSPIY